MKKILGLCVLVIAVFAIGLTLDIVVSTGGNAELAKAGINVMCFGTPITMTVCVAISLFMLFTGKWSFDESGEKKTAQKPTAEREAEKIADVNSSVGRESRIRAARFTAEHTAEAFKKIKGRKKILGILLFLFLIADFLLIFVFGLLNMFIGVIVCLCIFVGVISISLIVKAVRVKTSLSLKFNNEKFETVLATVLDCTLSGTVTAGGARRNSAVRIASAVYYVALEAEGRIYGAYSRLPYGEGDIAVVAVKKSGRGLARLIPENTVKQDTENEG